MNGALIPLNKRQAQHLIDTVREAIKELNHPSLEDNSEKIYALQAALDWLITAQPIEPTDADAINAVIAQLKEMKMQPYQPDTCTNPNCLCLHYAECVKGGPLKDVKGGYMCLAKQNTDLTKPKKP